ncbi:MAG: hemerythrin domain-containing protein [Planctomycetes bacterium]|nr:hemerythrin domain-containing protein [Planctomycetota bacterium]
MVRDLETVMMGLHEQLDHELFVHQQALLDRDYVRAEAALATYAGHLRLHMQDEETLVLPRYAELGGDGTDAPVRLFTGEHDKLRGFLAEFAERVAALVAAPDDRRLLELFDRQAVFKNLLLHHDLRERRMLYPFLGERLAMGEQGVVLAGLGFCG